MEKGIIPQSRYEKALEYSKEKILPIAEFFTGVACSSRSDWGRSVGHIVQGVIGGRGLSNLQKEVECYIDAGRIKKDFVTSIQGERCLVELLKFLEQEIPDHDRLELLRRIYIVSATEELHNRESPLPLQFMQIARSLTQGEIIVLFTAYRIDRTGSSMLREHFDLFVEETSLKYSELVLQHIQSLSEKRLLRQDGKMMTIMGRAFCEFVSYYDEKIAVPPTE